MGLRAAWNGFLFVFKFFYFLKYLFFNFFFCSIPRSIPWLWIALFQRYRLISIPFFRYHIVPSCVPFFTYLALYTIPFTTIVFQILPSRYYQRGLPGNVVRGVWWVVVEECLHARTLMHGCKSGMKDRVRNQIRNRVRNKIRNRVRNQIRNRVRNERQFGQSIWVVFFFFFECVGMGIFIVVKLGFLNYLF